ncbi:MAG: gamma carbonic anhydrase family protein [Chthoniobacterales bacterium]
MNFDDHIAPCFDKTPQVHPTAYIAPQTFLFGDVEIGERTSVWPFASLRGDISGIRIGACSNVQDGAVVHVSEIYPAIIGDYVTVGHKAIVHACKIGDHCLIGMGAVVLDGAEIGDHCIIGANATVKAGMVVPPGSMLLGTPAKITRTLSAEEQAGIQVWADHYLSLSARYQAKGI